MLECYLLAISHFSIHRQNETDEIISTLHKFRNNTRVNGLLPVVIDCATYA